MGTFITKLRKDNVGTLAAIVSWNVLTSVAAIVVSLLAISGLVLRGNPSAQQAEEDLTLLEEDVLLREMVARLVAELQPKRIYLFGSRARGDAPPDSDYDLLILIKKRSGEVANMEQQAYSVMWGLRAPVDIVVMTADYFDWMLDAAASLPATIKRKGRLLHAV